jgi:GNAT superfamily N-acetyltransferase
VVRQPITREVLGFCVILTAEDDLNDTPRFGSLAALVVRTECRGRGIGTHLHDAGIRAIAQRSGARDVRLGSTFPRLLHGIPDDSRFGGWFARRGWRGEFAPSSNNQDASDWLLDLGCFAGTGLSMAELSFQRCTPSDRDKVVNLVSGVCKRKSNLGWISQYTRLADSKFIGDIIVGFEGATVVSAGILCVGSVDHPFVQDMPWAQAIGTAVGSLSCICIIGTLPRFFVVSDKLTRLDPVPGMVNDRGSIMRALLEYCVKSLAGDGCKHMFLDAVRGGDHDLPELGE